MTRRSAIVAGQFAVNALGGKLGAPIMVLAYLSLALFLLAYVSTHVYTHSLMEDIAARKRAVVVLDERIGVLTAEYATSTSKSHVSTVCESQLGLVESTSADVVRVAVEGGGPAAPREDDIRVGDVLGSDVSNLSQVMRR